MARARLPSRWLNLPRDALGALGAALDRYFALALPQLAAGIAYRVLFSLVPLAIVLVAVFGRLVLDDALRARLIAWIVGWLPVSVEGEASIEKAIVELGAGESVLGLLSLAAFAWAATGMMAALRNGLETAFGVERRRPAARGKVVDFLLVAGAGALVIVAIGGAVVAQVVTRFVGGVAEALGADDGSVTELARVTVPLALATLVVVVLYRFVPSRRLRLRDAIVGGLVTGMLLLAISAASAALLEGVSKLSVVYGSITAVLVFLYSVYLYASALLFGAAVAAVWATRGERPPEPVRPQLRRALRGLFVPAAPDAAETAPRRTLEGALMQVLVRLPVSGCDDAADWYERLFARPPDARPQDGDPVWDVGPGGSVSLAADRAHAGTGSLTLRVADLDEQLAALAIRGLGAPSVETAADGRLSARLDDPDGNLIRLLEDWPARPRGFAASGERRRLGP
jgi:YihY family inner membrane protein